MVSIRVLPALAFLIAACSSRAAAPPPQLPTNAAELLSPAEFPDYDYAIWRNQRNGLALRATLDRLAEHPDSPEFAELLQQNHIDEALRRLRAIVTDYPAQIARAFEVAAPEWTRMTDEARGYPAALQDLVDAARSKLSTLPREEAARTERQLLLIDRRALMVPPDKRPQFADQLKTFVQRYAGTTTALLTEVDAIELGLPIRERLEALDAFVRQHPGTIAAAKALHVKGFHLSSGNVYPDIEPRGADPTARFFQVVEIVQELESGRYPPCEWVDRAPMLVAHFFAYKPTYAAGNVERLLDGYLAFVKTHFTVSDQHPLNTASGYVITTKMFDLFELKGDGVAGVERVFTELERELPDRAAVRYVRAVYYVRSSMQAESAEGRETFVHKALDVLTRLQAEGDGIYHRKALATLASVYFAEGRYRRARDEYAKYLRSYPNTPWAWVASLRIGQCSEALNEWEAAVYAYLKAASTHASIPLARVLGHAYAARAFEARGILDRVIDEYRAAIEGWDEDYGAVYSLPVPFRRNASQPRQHPSDPAVTRAALPSRIAQLQTAFSAAGGTLLERGRWLVEHGRHEEAVSRLEQLIVRYPQSAVIREARYLANRARFGRALALADVRNPKRDDAAALNHLRRIPAAPYNYAVCAAQIAAASIVVKTGAIAEAEAMMRRALTEWRDYQTAQRQPLRDPLERDIAEIRIVLMGPRRDAAAPFVIVDPEIAVRLADGHTRRLTVEHAIPDVEYLLFLNDEQQRMLNEIIALVGGTPSEQREGFDILGLWQRFFPAQRRLGGFQMDDRPRAELETSPVIAELEFLNAERTKAAARVIRGHQGGTMVLERQHGSWTVKASVNNSIS